MKKLILASAMMIGLISFSFAQTAAKPAKSEKAKTEVAKPAAKPVAKAATPAKAYKPAAKAATPAAVPATDKNGTVLKKDGTPDKRYKDARPVAKGPLKKDGTPDKRFKENKIP